MTTPTPAPGSGAGGGAVKPCTCERLMHHAGCEYDGPEITAAALAASEAARAALVAAFKKHRTATHEVKPTFCKTCRESDAAIALAEQPAATATEGQDGE